MPPSGDVRGGVVALGLALCTVSACGTHGGGTYGDGTRDGGAPGIGAPAVHFPAERTRASGDGVARDLVILSSSASAGADDGLRDIDAGVATRPAANPYAVELAPSIALVAVAHAAGTEGGGMEDAEAGGTGAGRAVDHELERDLERALETNGGQRVVPASAVRRMVGVDRVGSIVAELAALGTLSPESLQTLMAASLPAARGLFVRVDEDAVEPLEPLVEPMLDAAGRVLEDRQRLVLGVRRRTAITATLVDLHTGAVRARRSWRVEPISRGDYISYTGSGFAGAVAATLANTMVNGLEGPHLPAPPSPDRAFESLFGEVVASLRER